MWLIIITGTICLTALVVCTANPSDKIGQTAADEKTNNVKTTENSEYAKLLFSCKNRYIGNNSADGKLLNAIGVGENMGNFTIEMETSKTPYVLRLNFNNEVTDRDTFDRKMCPYAALLLALIDNADEIQWSYPYTQDGELQTITVYWNNQNLKSMGIDDIKSYGESVTQVQSLLKDLDSNALDIDLAYADNVTDISDGKPQDADTLIMNDILAQKDWGSLTIDYFKTFSNAVLEDNPDDSTLNSSIKFALLYGEETYELSVSYAKTDNRIDMIQLVKRSDMDSILLYSTEPKSSVNTDVKGFLE